MKRLATVHFALLLAASAGIGFSQTAPQSQRHALVIGNGEYVHAEALPNPPNDAADVAAALTKAGWQVTTVKNAGVKEMLRGLRLFCESAKGSESAIFFFAGHGIEVKGRNYLLPVDAELEEDDGEDALPLETVSLEKVLVDLARARIRLKTVVLDCCRHNPLSWLRKRGSAAGGLAEIKESQLPEGAMLVYSTAPGKTAEDGTGRNSPFTAALLERMRAGGGGISDVFGDVASALGSRQQAWIRFDGSGVSFTAFRDYPLVPGDRPAMRPKPVTAADRLRAATIDRPFVNSLGMEFVPVPGRAGVWMCRTETRVRDFRAYTQATDYVQTGGAHVMKIVDQEDGGGKTQKWELDLAASWEKPGFVQGEDHPVVCVSWEEAQAFCAWLSKKEAGFAYRLPTDGEWTAAVGSLTKYPWGNEFPPPKNNGTGVGNYWDLQAVRNLPGEGWENTVFDGSGYDDGAEWTARVGRYAPNRFGFFDLGGNVWEWCEDWYRDSMNQPDALEWLKEQGYDDGGGKKYRVVRGGSWGDGLEIYLRSSFRFYAPPDGRDGRGDRYGFRVVLWLGSGG